MQWEIYPPYIVIRIITAPWRSGVSERRPGSILGAAVGGMEAGRWQK
jgi:hypothetical protein